MFEISDRVEALALRLENLIKFGEAVQGAAVWHSAFLLCPRGADSCNFSDLRKAVKRFSLLLRFCRRPLHAV